MKYLSLSLPDVGGGTRTITPPIGVPTGGLEAGGAGINLIQLALTLFFVFGIIFTLIFIMYSGIQLILSQGDKQKVQKSHNRIIYSIIGLIIIVISFLIINLIFRFIDKPLFTFTTPPTPTQIEQPTIDEQLMGICTRRWEPSYCACLLRAKSTLEVDLQTQVSNAIIEAAQIPQEAINLAKSQCGDARLKLR